MCYLEGTQNCSQTEIFFSAIAVVTATFMLFFQLKVLMMIFRLPMWNSSGMTK